jgi:hypothetical protein
MLIRTKRGNQNATLHVWVFVFLFDLSIMGCRSSYNPFWQGPSQIPPPPTGSASQSDPYYSPRGASESVGLRESSYPSYVARAQKSGQARYTSESQSAHGDKEPSRIDDSLDSSSKAVPKTDTSFNGDLKWRSPEVGGVVTTTYETSRPRPRIPH